MPSLSKALPVTVLLVGAAVVWASPAVAAETANSEIVIVREDDVVADDLYAGAIRVIVEGEIDGDLIAFTGEDVVINGTVTGSVFVVAPEVTINGRVGGSLRMSGSSLTIDGEVAGDVVVAALNASFGQDSLIGGEALAWVMSMQSLGSVGGLNGSQRTLELGGAISGDVRVSVGHLRIVAPIEVGGDLVYRSDEMAEGLDRVGVEGVVVQEKPLPPNIRVRALKFFSRFLVVLFMTIAALTVAWGWPKLTSGAARGLRRTPFRSWGTGALVVFSPLILVGIGALIFALAPAVASIPLLAVFAPIVLATAGLVGALALVAGVPVVAFVGSVILKRASIYSAIVLGSVIVGIVWSLPFIGWLVPVVVLPIGLGAWFREWGQSSRPGREVGSGARG